jgi:hypothetical protein
MMVRRYPNVKEEVGDSITGNEISSLPDGKLAKWSTASYALMLACRPCVLKKNKEEEEEEDFRKITRSICSYLESIPQSNKEKPEDVNM